MSWQDLLDLSVGEFFSTIYTKIRNNLDYLKSEVESVDADKEPKIYKQATEPVYPDDEALWVNTSSEPYVVKMYDEHAGVWKEVAVEVIEHLIGGSQHTADTLANLNSKISDGDLDFDTAERPPSEHNNTKHTTDLVGEVCVISSLAAKATPVDADSLIIEDSAHDPVNTPKKLTWANLKATLKTYFDTLYSDVTTFLGLSDTPSDYTGHAGEVPAVNAGEDALEFVEVSTTVPAFPVSFEMIWRDDETFNQHYNLVLTTSKNPTTGTPLVDVSTLTSQTNWELYNGVNVQAFPSDGASYNWDTYLATYTVPAETLVRGTQYYVYRRKHNVADSIWGNFDYLGSVVI